MSASDASVPSRRAQLRAGWAAVEVAVARELAAMSDAEGLKRALCLKAFGNARPESRASSGLVEQQALFRRFVPP